MKKNLFIIFGILLYFSLLVSLLMFTFYKTMSLEMITSDLIPYLNLLDQDNKLNSSYGNIRPEILEEILSDIEVQKILNDVRIKINFYLDEKTMTLDLFDQEMRLKTNEIIDKMAQKTNTKIDKNQIIMQVEKVTKALEEEVKKVKNNKMADILISVLRHREYFLVVILIDILLILALFLSKSSFSGFIFNVGISGLLSGLTLFFMSFLLPGWSMFRELLDLGKGILFFSRKLGFITSIGSIFLIVIGVFTSKNARLDLGKK